MFSINQTYQSNRASCYLHSCIKKFRVEPINAEFKWFRFGKRSGFFCMKNGCWDEQEAEFRFVKKSFRSNKPEAKMISTNQKHIKSIELHVIYIPASKNSE